MKLYQALRSGHYQTQSPTEARKSKKCDEFYELFFTVHVGARAAEASASLAVTYDLQTVTSSMRIL